MKPTARLRFVERKVYVNKPARNVYGDEVTVSELVKKTILQQWWSQQHTVNMGWGEIPMGDENGEWRDIPLEEEK